MYNWEAFLMSFVSHRSFMLSVKQELKTCILFKSSLYVMILLGVTTLKIFVSTSSWFFSGLDTDTETFAILL